MNLNAYKISEFNEFYFTYSKITKHNDHFNFVTVIHNFKHFNYFL